MAIAWSASTHVQNRTHDYGAIGELPEIQELWSKTLGNPEIVVAILDGPVDLSHECLAKADLHVVAAGAQVRATEGPAGEHGTHVASVIFGQHDSPVKGLAPRCRGVIIPVFKDASDGRSASCSQLELAQAIVQAMSLGAHVINISGGEFSPTGSAHPLLSQAVEQSARNGVLIVAAAGNDGCDCIQIPATLPSVLVVGAMDPFRAPLESSNWAEEYRRHGILAPGENVWGARAGGGICSHSGTSYATPIVSGVAALLLSLQFQRGSNPSPLSVRDALLRSAIGCNQEQAPDCRRLLAGRLNVTGAMMEILKGGNRGMSDSVPITSEPPLATETGPPIGERTGGREQPSPMSGGLRPSGDIALDRSAGPSNLPDHGIMDDQRRSVIAAGCQCGANEVLPQLVFALGQLGYDFGMESRRDSIMQHMKQPANPNDPHQILAYLDENPWDAAALLWTLSLDTTPIYAIRAQGPFASETYERLRLFLGEQSRGEVERVSIPGIISGTHRLSTGQAVPVIWPALRGMYSWNTAALVKAASGGSEEGTEAVLNFLRRVYDELRNLGVTPQDRAINYAATNAFQPAQIFKTEINEKMDLDTIEVERSPICRPGSDCWDVKLSFFNPRRALEQARKVCRFTVDVSDVVPVMVGPVRHWFAR